MSTTPDPIPHGAAKRSSQRARVVRKCYLCGEEKRRRRLSLGVVSESYETRLRYRYFHFQGLFCDTCSPIVGAAYERVAAGEQIAEPRLVAVFRDEARIGCPRCAVPDHIVMNIDISGPVTHACGWRLGDVELDPRIAQVEASLVERYGGTPEWSCECGGVARLLPSDPNEPAREDVACSAGCEVRRLDGSVRPGPALNAAAHRFEHEYRNTIRSAATELLASVARPETPLPPEVAAEQRARGCLCPECNGSALPRVADLIRRSGVDDAEDLIRRLELGAVGLAAARRA